MFAEPSMLYEPDVPKVLASEAAAAMRPMSIRAAADISPGLAPDWAKFVYKGHMAYIRSTKDACLPLAFQDLMLKDSGGDRTLDGCRSQPFSKLSGRVNKDHSVTGRGVCRLTPATHDNVLPSSSCPDLSFRIMMEPVHQKKCL